MEVPSPEIPSPEIPNPEIPNPEILSTERAGAKDIIHENTETNGH